MGSQLIAYPRIPIYSVANAAALAALTSMQEGDLCYQEDTSEWYYYNGSSFLALSGEGVVLASDNILMKNATSRNVTANATYVKLKQFQVIHINPTNTLRINWTGRSGYTTGKQEIRKNGVAIAGTEVSTTSADIDFTDDISNVSSGDTIEIWGKHDTGNYFSLCVDLEIGPTLGASNAAAFTYDLDTY